MPKRRAPALKQIKKRKRGRRITFQQGSGGIPVFRAEPLQRGYGIGGLFHGLYRCVKPALKRSLATIGKKALKAGTNVLEDIVVNKAPIKQAVKRQAKPEFENLKKQYGGSQKAINRGFVKSKPVIRAKRRKQKRRFPGFKQITL